MKPNHSFVALALSAIGILFLSRSVSASVADGSSAKTSVAAMTHPTAGFENLKPDAFKQRKTQRCTTATVASATIVDHQHANVGKQCFQLIGDEDFGVLCDGSQAHVTFPRIVLANVEREEAVGGDAVDKATPGTVAVAGVEAKQPSVFDLPRIAATQAAARRAVTALFAAGEYAKAEALLLRAIKQFPYDARTHYNLACALGRLGKTDGALNALATAVALGFREPKHIDADEDFKSIRSDERFKALLKKAAEPHEKKPIGWNYKVTPTPIEDGQVMVSEKNTVWTQTVGLFQTMFKLDREATKDRPIVNGMGEVGKLLRKWYDEGTAAGNHGDLYDNHDNEHSNMNYKGFPQLTRIEFDAEAKKRGLHHGLQRHFIYNGVTIGNSSTALTRGPYWRSQPRYVLTLPGGPNLLYRHYTSNHLYFYPEHRDHDPGHNNKNGKGYGDVYPVNTPYLIISQGSSGSDRAFMNAIAATLAAFRPDVKAKLTKQGMIVPTLQMIFRVSNKQVQQDSDYLTGKAHPTVFDGKQIDTMKMIQMAHAMTPDVLPPLVRLKVVEEDQPVLGRDYFDVAARERLIDSPSSIGRIMKSSQYMRRMVISAEESSDVSKSPLKFHWKVLRGDADRIKIKPLNDAGSVVELLVPYHERMSISHGSAMASNRVDIGAFVHNGEYHSAPAFVSFYFLDNEKREYSKDGRILVVDYTDAEKQKNYVDPMLDFKKNWRDDCHYNDAGKLTGWTRTRGDDRQQFTADGRLVIKADSKGKPTKTVRVRYVAKHAKDKVPVLEQQFVAE